MEQQVAQTLLNEGVKVQANAPLLFRLFGKRTITLVLRAPTAGTIDRIAERFHSSGITKEELNALEEMEARELFSRFGKVMCQIVAVALINTKRAGKLFAPVLGRWLYWHLTALQIIGMMNVIVMLITKEAFINTIKSVATLSLTAPNLSQMEQGS